MCKSRERDVRMLVSVQLLGITIQHEKPELEVRKTDLLRQEEDLKIQLAQLEDSLLEVCHSFCSLSSSSSASSSSHPCLLYTSDAADES